MKLLPAARWPRIPRRTSPMSYVSRIWKEIRRTMYCRFPDCSLRPAPTTDFSNPPRSAWTPPWTSIGRGEPSHHTHIRFGTPWGTLHTPTTNPTVKHVAWTSALSRVNSH
jgi:hypothetical protein